MVHKVPKRTDSLFIFLLNLFTARPEQSVQGSAEPLSRAQEQKARINLYCQGGAVNLFKKFLL